MPLDPDLIRVDLLKIRRKIFKSYSDGSKEQKDFLMSSKLSEINYLSSIVPQETATLVFEEHQKTVLLECLHIGFSLIMGSLLSVLVYLLTKGFPFVWLIPIFGGISIACFHGQHLHDAFKDIKPFKYEYEALENRINKLTDELKELE